MGVYPSTSRMPLAIPSLARMKQQAPGRKVPMTMGMKMTIAVTLMTARKTRMLEMWK